MNIHTNWHSWTPEMLCEGLKTDPVRGLHPRDAEKRLSRSGTNNIWKVKRASAGEFALKMLLDLATLLLLVVAIVAAIFDKNSVLIPIILTVVLGGAARVLLHVRTQRIFEEKARGVIPRTTVIRGGEASICSAENLVEGDVILIETGDTVPADVRTLSTAGILVYENKMTDNKSVVVKNALTISEDPGVETPIENRDNMLYAGSTVVSGEARCVVVARGDKTLAVSKYGTLTIPSGEKLKTTDKLTRWSRILSIAMLVTVAVITLIGAAVRGNGALEVLLSACALAVSTMSESLSIIGEYSIATAVRKSDSEECGRAKVKDAATTETLSRADTIVIESPSMIKAGDITLNSYYIGDRLINVDEPVEGISPSMLLKLCYVTTGMLPQGALSNGMIAPPRESSSIDYGGIRKIFEEYFRRSPEDRALENTLLAGHEPAGSPDSGGLDTALICRNGNFEGVVSGSVEEVLSCCNSIYKGGRILPMTKEDAIRIMKEVDLLRRRGIFTVGVARRDSPYSNMNRVSALQMCMTFEGFLALSDRAHGDALDALRKCREGNETRMVVLTEGSGEDKAFLEMIGLLSENDKYITLEEALSADKIELSPGQFAAVCTGARDAAKVRREIVRKLRAGGCSLVYISKEPSDMWLMKEAPVSFAVPAAAKIKKTIPQSIRSASDVVVTPQSGGGIYESFRTLEYAKGAMLNLKRCAGYLAASFIAKTVLCLVAAIMSKIPPASPSALLIWGLLLDLAVSFVSLRRDPPWNISSVDKSTYELQSSYIDFARPAVIGAIWGLLLIAVPAAIITFLPEGHSYRGAGAVTNQVFVAALLSVPVVGGEMMTNGSIFKRSKRRSRAIPALFLLSLVLSLLFAFFKGVAATVAANVISFKLYLVTFVPAVLFLIVFETIKIIERKKKKPEDTSAGNGEKS